MKQSDDPKAFFEKYKFTQSSSKPHPVHKDSMNFEGLEADYVSTLELKITQLEKYIGLQNDKIDFLMNKEFYKWKKVDEKWKDHL